MQQKIQFIAVGTFLRFFSNVLQKFNIWKNDCISAEAIEEDLKMIASDNETFTNCIHTFDFICLKCL